MKTSSLVKNLLGFLLAFFVGVAITQVQINRDSPVFYANFFMIHGKFLNATGIVPASNVPNSPIDCGYICLHNHKCVSYNYGGSSGTNCKIFAMDRFSNSSSFQEDKNYDYYYVKVCLLG